MEWLYENGIGETRAALVDDGRIVEAAIERDGTLTVGTVARAQLVELLAGRTGRLDLAGAEVVLTRIPSGLTQGATLTVEIVREPIAEPGRLKPARAIPSGDAPRPGPDLRARIEASGHPVRPCFAHQPDALEAAGWSELLDEATTGDIAFAGGALRMTPTPAMTLFDVDGHPPLDTLSIAAAHAVADAIRRHGIGGSIGIDFPTLTGKPQRQAVDMALEQALPTPFEKTAINGFGFVQIVRPRPRPSLPELLRGDPVGAAARAALRILERTPPGAPLGHRLPAAVLARIRAHPGWLADLARRTGVVHQLESL